jgi:hypothetical protein
LGSKSGQLLKGSLLQQEDPVGKEAELNLESAAAVAAAVAVGKG